MPLTFERDRRCISSAFARDGQSSLPRYAPGHQVTGKEGAEELAFLNWMSWWLDPVANSAKFVLKLHSGEHSFGPCPCLLVS